MKYSLTAYDKAENELKRRREAVANEHEAHAQEIAQKLPEIAALSRTLTENNCDLLKNIVGQKGHGKDLINKIRMNNLNTQRAIKDLLKAGGYPEDYLDYHYNCPKCCDYGYRDGVKCQCFTELLKKYTIEELNENCSIKLHDFSEFRIDFYPDSDSSGMSPRDRMRTVYSNCREYADKFHTSSPSLFFFGRTGLGKTFLSSCIANELTKKGYSVVFGSLLKLLRQIEDEHFGRAEGQTLDIIENADLVILDDLGSEFQTSFTDAVLYEIINERINLNKPTIISTNLTKNELNSKYNERIVSRLTGCFSPIMFMGSDIRHVKLKNNL